MPREDEVTLRAKPAPWGRGVEILIRDHEAVATNLIMKKVELGEQIEPTLELDSKQAQTLIDDLWQCGYRPTEGTGSAGSLKATETHLADMRRIAFDLMGKKIGQ